MRFNRSDVAIVTGAGRGIGRAVCELLSTHDVAVAALDIDKAGADQTAKIVHANGGRCIAVECDVSSRDQVSACVNAVESELGPVTIVVNNAAICPTAPFLEQTDKLWRRVLDVNLTGTFIVTQEAADRMLPRRHGRIVNVSSTQAHRGFENSASYAASKGAVEAFTRSVAFELGDHGIRVNAVAVGPVLTELNAAVLSDQDRDTRIGRMATGRMGQPIDVAEAVCFLASLDSSFIQGATLPVEGGFLIGGVRGGTRVTEKSRGAAPTPEVTQP
jgi:3-oxoacyl-[acyl-carrier protein] reductase